MASSIERRLAQRRLAVICSHLRRADVQRLGLSSSACHGGGEEVGPAEGSGEEGCIFCMIIRGQAPALKLYEDDICLCILDSNPLSYGHSLLIPKLHFSALGVTPSIVAAMCSKVPFLASAIMKATHCDSFHLLVNNGSAAGQVIFHTHFHIIPRKSGDELWPSENCRRQSLKWNQETLDLVDCIREVVSSFTDNLRHQESVFSKDS